MISKKNRSPNTQYPVVSMQPALESELHGGNEVALIRVPAGAIVEECKALVTAAGTATSSMTVGSVEGAGASVNNDLIASVDLASEGATVGAGARLNTQFVEGGWILAVASNTAVDGPGRVLVYAKMLIEGRHHEIISEPAGIVPPDTAP